MNAIGKILLFLVATVFLGALLGPPLLWLAESLQPWAIEHGWLVFEQKGASVNARGPLSFLATDLETAFHRGVMIVALALLWPVGRWLGINNLQDLGVAPFPQWWQRFAAGFALAFALVALMAVAYVGFDIYRWRSPLPWGRLPGLLLSAVVVAVLEELLFRGAILGVLRKAFRPFVALFLVSAFFAAVHFLKADDIALAGPVRWHSGFALLPPTFVEIGRRFVDPTPLLAEFATLFVLGWVLGYAALRTRTIWMSAGLHAGVVFVKMGFSKFTKRQEEILPWVGQQLQIGLVPLAVLVVMGVCVWAWLRLTDRGRAGR